MEGLLRTCRICGSPSQSRLGWRVAAQPVATRERLAVFASGSGNSDNQSARQRKVCPFEAVRTQALIMYLILRVCYIQNTSVSVLTGAAATRRWTATGCSAVC